MLDSGLSWEEELECALRALATLLRDEKTISWYEVHMSRLVPVVLHCLTGARSTVGGEGEGEGPRIGSEGTAGVSGPEEDKIKERIELFKKTFAEASDELTVDLDSR